MALADTDLLDYSEAAKVLNVSVRTLRGHVRDGAIPYVAIGRGLRRPKKAFMRSDISTFIQLGKLVAAPVAAPKNLAPRVDYLDTQPQKDRKVYFIRAGDAVKIGIASDPHDRLAKLQTAHHQKLELIFVTKGGRAHERTLHKRFKPYALTGEWFRYDGKLRAYLEQRMARP